MNIQQANYKKRGCKRQCALMISLLLLIGAAVCFLDTHILRPILLIADFILILCLIWHGFVYERSFFELHNAMHVLQILFDVAFGNEMIQNALNELGHIIDAESVYFIFEEDGVSRNSYKYEDRAFADSLTLEEQIAVCRAVLPQGQYNKVVRLRRGSKNQNRTAAKIMEEKGIYNIECVEVKSAECDISGILLSVNGKRRIRGQNFEYVASMLLAPIIKTLYVKKLESMSKLDSLTGLLNRNSYQTTLAGYANALSGKLVCIYIDFNGLHNINNIFGHDKGDQMLRTAADILVDNFGSDDVFRIGGDEFVVLSQYTSGTDMKKRISNMRRELIENECMVAIGIEWCGNSSDIDSAIKRAEEKMFEDKRMHRKEEKRI